MSNLPTCHLFSLVSYQELADEAGADPCAASRQAVLLSDGGAPFAGARGAVGARVGWRPGCGWRGMARLVG